MNLYAKKLASSGLTLGDGDKLCFRYLSSLETKALCPIFKEREALYIPFIDPQTGKQWIINPGTPAEYAYYRIRYLYSDEGQSAASLSAKVGFASIIAQEKQKKKPERYVQPPKTPPLIYYPTNTPVPWKDIFNNIDAPIFLTEGELKAAKACSVGYPTVSIGGVHAYQQLSKGITLLPSIVQIGLNGRIIYVCFDSDYREKPGILNAIHSFTDELAQHGAEVRCISLPDLYDDKKTGLDDFFLYYGEAGIPMFKDLVTKAHPLGCINSLRKYNSRYVACSSPTSIIDSKLNKILSKSDFSLITDPDIGIEQYLSKDGDLRYRKTQLNALWLKWGQRRSVDILCYEPGKDKLCDVEYNNTIVSGYNSWTRWAVPPKKGDSALFEKLIDHVFSLSTPEAKHWFLQWAAYPIQHPGYKLKTSVLIHGNVQGSGKSSIGVALARLYGAHANILTQNNIADVDFNSWAVDKSFILVDDIGSQGNKNYANKLKVFITAPSIEVNRKFVDPYNIKNVMNFMFTSNDPAALYIEKTDRRFFIIEAPQSTLPPEFYNTFYAWIDSDEGASALMYYLSNYDLSGFDPNAHALLTDAKRMMRDLNLSDLGRFIMFLCENPDHFTARFKGDLATASDILTLFKDDDLATETAKSLLTVGGVGKELGAIGVPRLFNGTQIRMPNDERQRFYILRNVGHWNSATQDDVKSYLSTTYRPAQIPKSRGEKF